MYGRNTMRKLVGGALCAILVAFSVAAQAGGAVQFMDLQWLQPGVSPTQAGAYFHEALGPIVRKHGGKLLFTYQVLGVMKRDLKPAVIAGKEFPTMDAMQNLFKDPDYQSIVPQRDRIFDLSQMRLFQIAPIGGI